MLDGTYEFYIDTKLGKGKATAVVATQGNTVTAEVDAPIIGKRRFEGTASGDTFVSRGTLKILLIGKVDYTIKGTVEGDEMSMSVNTTMGNANLKGVRIA